MDQIIDRLQQLHNFTGHPGKFWPTFLELAAGLAKARACALFARSHDSDPWRRLSVWPAEDSLLLQSLDLAPVIQQVAEASVAKGCTWDSKRINSSINANIVILGLRLKLDETDLVHTAVFLLDEMDPDTVEQTANMLKLVADTPEIYRHGRSARKAMDDAVKFSASLDLMVLLNAEKKYMAAAMTFVNELASRHRCIRASIGWLDGGYVRLQAISHMERFEKKTDIVRALETAMEEASDQNEEILWPPVKESNAVVRDHEAYSRQQGIQFIVSLPIRLDDVPVGVLTCEKSERPFTETEVCELRILCDQAARRLGDLNQNESWTETRVIASLRGGAQRLLGIEHTFARGIGLLLCGVFLFLLIGKLPYRVEAPFILRSENVKYLPAPFDGYIDKVLVKAGAQVKENDLLLTLNTKDLLLEESAALANKMRYSSEAEKARAENSLAEMKIALAQAEQANARIELVRHHLSRAEVRAPFSGIVVEGDLEELQGAAVTKGKALFKVAHLEKMYAELEVSERDIHELTEGMAGEMAFVSQPRIKFPFKVERIEPVALAQKDKGNVFLIRCVFTQAMADWWNPGMSGEAKITVGKRNALWILTHRTVDFLRIRLWW